MFSGLTFVLSEGGLLQVGGPNGSGKTSLLRIACGFLKPASGTIEWNGGHLHLLGDDYTGNIAYVGHSNAVKDDLNVLENLCFSARLAGLPTDASALEATLSRFAFAGLEHLPCKVLSQGQKRRLALSRLSLSAGRPLWVLDEPFASLDPAGIEVVRSVIEAHLARGGMALLTTHQDVSISASSHQRIELAA